MTTFCKAIYLLRKLAVSVHRQTHGNIGVAVVHGQYCRSAAKAIAKVQAWLVMAFPIEGFELSLKTILLILQ